MKPRGAGFVEQHYRALLSPFFLSNTFQAGVQRRLDYTTNILFFMANIATSLLFSYNAISFPVPSIFSHLLAYSVLALMPTRLIYRDAPKKYIVCARSRSRGHLETHVRVQMHQGCE